MQVGNILRSSRVDILLNGQGSGATALFIYSGEARCELRSGDNTTIRDQLVIELPDGDVLAQQLVQFQTGVSPQPIVVPTNWNANGGFHVLAVESSRMDVHPETGRGIFLIADLAVQNAMLLGVAYQVNVRVNLS